MLSTLWGASYSFIKVGVQSIPPVTLIAVRTLIAGALLLLVIRWRGVMLPRDASSWQRFFIQACLNSVVPFTLMAWAQQTTDATLATILNSTSPIFAFMLTALVARHEVVTRRRLFGVGAGFVGICLIVGVQALCRLQLWVRNWTTPELPVATVASWPSRAAGGRQFSGGPAAPEDAAGSRLRSRTQARPGTRPYVSRFGASGAWSPTVPATAVAGRSGVMGGDAIGGSLAPPSRQALGSANTTLHPEHW